MAKTITITLPDVTIIDGFGQEWTMTQLEYSRLSYARRRFTAYSSLTPPPEGT